MCEGEVHVVYKNYFGIEYLVEGTVMSQYSTTYICLLQDLNTCR